MYCIYIKIVVDVSMNGDGVYNNCDMSKKVYINCLLCGIIK